ncbi:MAG: cytochrome c-type protein NapB [Myxococcota bacterium]|jgi:cytochrome c-type protein NapB
MSGRAGPLLLAAIVGAAFAGFFVGVSETSGSEYSPSELSVSVEEPVVQGSVAPAKTHTEMGAGPLGPRNVAPGSLRQITPDASKPPLPPCTPGRRVNSPESPGECTPLVRSGVERRRGLRRAYDGAPPMIPHRSSERSAASCMTCHRAGVSPGGVVAPAIPHREFASCTQCHAALDGSPPFATPSLPVETAAPYALSSGWTRIEPIDRIRGGPPQIPHDTWMREACTSCHGPTGPRELQTSHPERQSCTQCHSPPSIMNPPRLALP